MVFHQELLPGVYLTAVQTDKFKTDCMSINFVRPLCREEATMNALLPDVLLRGSESCPDMRTISAFLDEHYGATVGALVRKKGEVQTTGFYAEFLDDALSPDGSPVLEPMLSFLGDLLLHPALEGGVFAADYVRSEAANLRNTLAARINEKRSYASMQMIRTMCGGEAYAVNRLGEEEALAQITPASLYAHYRRILETSRVELFYMGRTELTRIASLLRGMLASLPRGALAPVATQVKPQPGEVREVTERLDVTQGKLCLGLRTGGITLHDAAYPALVLLNAVYGAGVTSKLFRNVREKLSLCYYASSVLEKYKGIVLISSGVTFANMERAKDEILRQLELCRAGEIGEDELEDARRYLLSAYRASQDSPGTLDDYYIGQALAGVDLPLETLAARVRAVTKDEVAEAAKRVALDTVYYLKGAEA